MSLLPPIEVNKTLPMPMRSKTGYFVAAAMMANLMGAAQAPEETQSRPAQGTSALHYKIFRKGKSIGDHHVTVQSGDEIADVDIAFSIRVKFLGITAFRMDHEASEQWSLLPVALKSLTAVTDRSSGTFKVDVDPAETGYVVTVNGEESVAPPEVVPTSFTLARHLFDEEGRAIVLLDTLSGTLRPSRIHYRRPANKKESKGFANPVGTVSYYEITRDDTGEVTHKIWYDETDAFVQVGLKTKDGHYVEYRRQA